MGIITDDAQYIESLSLLNECLQQGAIDLVDVGALAKNTSAKLANLNEYSSIEETAATSFHIWNQVQSMDRPNGPDHNQIIDEICTS